MYFTKHPTKPGRNITFIGHVRAFVGLSCDPDKPDKPMLGASIKNDTYKDYLWQKPYDWGTSKAINPGALPTGLIFKVYILYSYNVCL